VSCDPRLPVLAIVGLAREAQLAAGPDAVVIPSGGSPERLRSALERRPPAFRAVLSFGFAGGLDPALSPGDVVVATAIVAGGKRWPADLGIARAWQRALSAAGQSVTMAEIAGLEAPVLDPVDKAACRYSTGAVAADMESHVAAAFAARHGLPFAALRAVCDPAWRALPPLAAGALRPDGRIALRAILRELVQRPGQVAALPRLSADAAAALASLGRCRSALGPRFGILGLSEPLGDVP
jgi:hopanoid-associated phosphorylase